MESARPGGEVGTGSSRRRKLSSGEPESGSSDEEVTLYEQQRDARVLFNSRVFSALGLEEALQNLHKTSRVSNPPKRHGKQRSGGMRASGSKDGVQAQSGNQREMRSARILAVPGPKPVALPKKEVALSNTTTKLIALVQRNSQHTMSDTPRGVRVPRMLEDFTKDSSDSEDKSFVALSNHVHPPMRAVRKRVPRRPLLVGQKGLPIIEQQIIPHAPRPPPPKSDVPRIPAMPGAMWFIPRGLPHIW